LGLGKSLSGVSSYFCLKRVQLSPLLLKTTIEGICADLKPNALQPCG